MNRIDVRLTQYSEVTSEHRTAEGYINYKGKSYEFAILVGDYDPDTDMPQIAELFFGLAKGDIDALELLWEKLDTAIEKAIYNRHVVIGKASFNFKLPRER